MSTIQEMSLEDIRGITTMKKGHASKIMAAIDEQLGRAEDLATGGEQNQVRPHSSMHAENVYIFSSSKPNHEVYVWLAELNMERYFDAFLEDG